MKRSRDGYRDRRRSSRRLAQETQRNVDLRGLGKTLRPAPPTIAPLRTHNRAPLRQVGRAFTRRCKKLDLFGAERVAMDGSTVRAVNANARPFTQGTLNKRIGPIDERVDADLTELDRRADQEAHGTGGGGHAATLAATREALKPRNLLEEGFQAQLRARGQAHLSLPAPERHALKRGTSAMLRRQPARAGRARSRARAITADGGFRAGSMSSGWRRGSRGCGVGEMPRLMAALG